LTVIFDEASQVRPVDALGAILRGKQIVVVGDSKQLPPTAFFDNVSGDEDGESITGDLESVLGLFRAKGCPSRMLRWHYRSRHESLIATSNTWFYENKLITFPSPDIDRAALGLCYRYIPEGVYDSGGSSTNRMEARRVAEAAMKHAARTPEKTLGIGAFSMAQMEAIIDELEILRRQHPETEAFFNSHPDEPFFVKNLENIQGDERDVIYISVGYGRDANGQVRMNFGPLNKDGGERRLNVLITRARERCEVFTNLSHEDLDLSRSAARGVEVLKSYLKYAKTGDFQIPGPPGGEYESPFEQSVADALRAQGYLVHPQVGVAGFRIDLAIVDTARPGRYVIGIECDGATYHRAQTARDRDRIRQAVLESLGWKIHRIWSTDWFHHAPRAFKQLCDVIDQATVRLLNESYDCA
jgi:superfamily I DNA and/or RNA helicase